jgi:hypothetical protein
MTQHYAMLQRNLLYTGITRGKRLVMLVGQKKAVAIAVRNVSGRRRWSKLSEWLNPRRSSAGVQLRVRAAASTAQDAFSTAWHRPFGSGGSRDGGVRCC